MKNTLKNKNKNTTSPTGSRGLLCPLRWPGQGYADDGPSGVLSLPVPSPGAGPGGGGWTVPCGREQHQSWVGGRHYLVSEAAVQVGPASCRRGLGAQEGPEHRDRAEEELAAAQAAA